MLLPNYIDNSPSNKLQTILDIAIGFFRIEAWVKLEPEMNQLTSLRLLIGRDPTIRPAESDRIDLIRDFKENIQKGLELHYGNIYLKRDENR